MLSHKPSKHENRVNGKFAGDVNNNCGVILWTSLTYQQPSGYFWCLLLWVSYLFLPSFQFTYITYRFIYTCKQTIVKTSNGSWRQGIKGEMSCTIYVALLCNINCWICAWMPILFIWLWPNLTIVCHTRSTYTDHNSLHMVLTACAIISTGRCI